MEPLTASYCPALHGQRCWRWTYGNTGPGGRIHENTLFLPCGVCITSCLPLYPDVFRYIVPIVAYARILVYHVSRFFSTRHQYYIGFPFPTEVTNLFYGSIHEYRRRLKDWGIGKRVGKEEK